MKGFTHTGRGPSMGHDFSKKVPTVDSFFPGTPRTMSANGSTLHPSAGKPKAPVQHFARGGLIPADKVAARAAKGKRVGTMKKAPKVMKKADGGPVIGKDELTGGDPRSTVAGEGSISDFDQQMQSGAPPGEGSISDVDAALFQKARSSKVIGRNAPMVRDPSGMPMVGARAPGNAHAAVQAEMSNPKAQQALKLLQQAEAAGIMPKDGPMAKMSQLVKQAVSGRPPVKRAQGGPVGNALTQRGAPFITEQDRAAKGTSPLAPGFGRGGLQMGARGVRGFGK